MAIRLFCDKHVVLDASSSYALKMNSTSRFSINHFMQIGT